jgi:hypothetical protein
MAPLNFEKYFSSTILSRGRLYYTNNKVIHLTEEGSTGSGDWYAQVKGSSSIYAVEIQIGPKGEIISWNCECPYGNGCKHQAAVLYKIKEQAGRITVNIKKEIKAKTPSTEEALATYATLSETEQRLLKISAVAYEPASQTKLMDLFNIIGFKNGSKNLYANDIRPILQKLVAEGLLIYNPNNHYECPKPFADALCDKYFAADPDFNKTIRPILKEFPLYSNWYGYNDNNRIFRDMRIGRFNDDPAAFSRGFMATHQNNSYNAKPKFDQRSLTDYWLGEQFDLAKTQTFGKRVLAFLLSHRLTLDTFDLAPTNKGFFSFAHDTIEDFHKDDQRPIGLLLAQLCLFKGDWQAVGRLTKYLDAVMSAIFAGFKLLMDGQGQQALDTFDLTQKAMRKESGNSKEVLVGLGGIIHILAYLKSQDTKLYKKIHTHVKQANTYHNSYAQTYRHLEAVAYFLENNKPIAEQQLKEKPNSELAKFFHFLCQFWVSDSLVKINDLASYRDSLLQNGYAWMAAEMNALLAELGRPTDGCPLPEGQPLCLLLPRIEEWENALKVLHVQKRDLADSLLAGTDVSAKLSAEDLMKLLREG